MNLRHFKNIFLVCLIIFGIAFGICSLLDSPKLMGFFGGMCYLSCFLYGFSIWEMKKYKRTKEYKIVKYKPTLDQTLIFKWFNRIEKALYTGQKMWISKYYNSYDVSFQLYEHIDIQSSKIEYRETYHKKIKMTLSYEDASYDENKNFKEAAYNRILQKRDKIIELLEEQYRKEDKIYKDKLRQKK